MVPDMPQISFPLYSSEFTHWEKELLRAVKLSHILLTLPLSFLKLIHENLANKPLTKFKKIIWA